MKINPDKLTDFETQLATMFELRIGDVSASPGQLRVPDMPLIAITRWGAHVVPPQPATTATWYRELTWRGQILARQLHRRALARVVDEKKLEQAPVNTAAAGQAIPVASGLNAAAVGLARRAPGLSKSQIMGGATNMRPLLDSYQYDLNKQVARGMGNLANASPNMQAALNNGTSLFYGVPLNELVNAGVDPSLIAGAKKGNWPALEQLIQMAESLQLKKL